MVAAQRFWWHSVGLLLAVQHGMIVGTVLFQPSSYGKENKLLCCLGNDASEPAGSSFTGRMLGETAVFLHCPVGLKEGVGPLSSLSCV